MKSLFSLALVAATMFGTFAGADVARAGITVRSSQVEVKTGCPSLQGMWIESSAVYLPSNLDGTASEIDISEDSRVIVVEDDAPCLGGRPGVVVGRDIYISESQVDLYQQVLDGQAKPATTPPSTTDSFSY